MHPLDPMGTSRHPAWRRRTAALLAGLLAACAAQCLAAGEAGDEAATARRGNVLNLRKPRAATVDRRPEIEPFVHWARAGDVEALVMSFDDVPLKANGEAAIRHFATHEVMPFFLDAERIDDPIRVTQATFEDGSEGHMAYAYLRTRGGEVRPFVIAWRSGADRLRVMDVQLGRCVASRHPVSPGHCDR